MLTSIFILVLNNGESYDDEDHWNAGIFKSLEDAKTFAINNRSGYDYLVEEWNIQGLIKQYDFDF
jgi:hypothetical protein